MKTFTSQSAARAYVERINAEEWAVALKRADDAVAHDDIDGWLHWDGMAKALFSEMQRVESLLPTLPA